MPTGPVALGRYEWGYRIPKLYPADYVNFIRFFNDLTRQPSTVIKPDFALGASPLGLKPGSLFILS
jgi:hypothetical protein